MSSGEGGSGGLPEGPLDVGRQGRQVRGRPPPQPFLPPLFAPTPRARETCIPPPTPPPPAAAAGGLTQRTRRCGW